MDELDSKVHKRFAAEQVAVRSKVYSRFTPEQIAEIRRNPPRLLSIFEAAVYLDLCTHSVRAKAKARLIPYIKVGGRWLFRREALDAALLKLEVRAVA
jgi:excisionase family DNA binding protein